MIFLNNDAVPTTITLLVRLLLQWIPLSIKDKLKTVKHLYINLRAEAAAGVVAVK